MSDDQSNPSTSKQRLNEQVKQKVQCPHCKVPNEWSESNPYRPFCSETCKNNDFVGWANEQHRIAGSSEYDDLLSEAQDLGQAPDSPLH